ncbi:M10 family metallopeptidase C-terminal domain-containing protein [Yoonia sp.]|uniref:M10 family metallopeptidase C-terminal domain-containing protein n=1 Tax=Yoonia sp. TaxID=2212373 RepID=UPI003F6C0DE6
MPDPTSPVATLDSGASLRDRTISVHFVAENRTAAFAGLTTDEKADVISDGWAQAEIDRVMAALAGISTYADLTFVQTSDQNADFQMVLDNDELNDPDLLGYFYQPSTPDYTGALMGVFNVNGHGWTTLGLLAGGLGYSTIIHEVLHGLGLDHPHDGDLILDGLDPEQPDYPFGDFGDFNLNQTVYTIMSYNDGYAAAPSQDNDTGSAMGPMALDIAMLQEIYGANLGHANGNDSYDLTDVVSGWLAIWDTGGRDTITYHGSRDVTLDLRAATLRYEDGGGGFVSAADGIAGGYTIAAGVVIEDATGGNGNDMLIGNDAANVLTGRTGADTLIGGGNNDSLHGNSGSDAISGTAGTNLIYGNSGADRLTGGNGSDTIFGNAGNDIMVGGATGDLLNGGRGDDTLDGGAGPDILNGGIGHDRLTGGAGADTFVFDFISDSWAGRADTITDFEVGIDRIDLSGIDADLAMQGNQSLQFGDAGNLTDTSGNIWVTVAGRDTFVHVDRDGDSIAEMGALMQNVNDLTDSDFIL